MMYVRHILSSFTNHYSIDLSDDGNCYANNPQVMREIFDSEMIVESVNNSTSKIIKKFQNFTFNVHESIKISQERETKKKKKEKSSNHHTKS